MKVKHNKKRNTAFVYEALINEATVAVLKDDFERSTCRFHDPELKISHLLGT